LVDTHIFLEKLSFAFFHSLLPSLIAPVGMTQAPWAKSHGKSPAIPTPAIKEDSLAFHLRSREDNVEENPRHKLKATAACPTGTCPAGVSDVAIFSMHIFLKKTSPQQLHGNLHPPSLLNRLSLKLSAAKTTANTLHAHKNEFITNLTFIISIDLMHSVESTK
jgi:hypothetical protein